MPQDEHWLTEAEAARAAAMRFTKRRNEYLLRRYAGKRAVAAALGSSSDPRSLGRIGVLNRMTGAPYAQVDGRDLGLDISLTDRAGWAVCLLGPDLGAVGVDLEIVEPRSEGFVRDFLTVAEREVVETSADSDAAANLIWSAKESALKVLRTGLRADTRTVEVKLVPAGSGWQRLSVATGAGRLPGWWRRDGAFLLTVVADAMGEPPRALPGSADLAGAEPVHSWVANPLVMP